VGSFLAIVWDPGDDLAVADARAAEAKVEATDDWTLLHRDVDVLIWGRGRKRPAVYGQGPVLVVGTCLRRGSCDPVRRADLHPHVMARSTAEHLCRETWGAYVGLLADGDRRSLFRDLSGGSECFSWSLGRVRLVTSEAGPPIPALLPHRPGLNWAVIAAWMVDPCRAVIASGLDGVEIVPPGCLWRPDGDDDPILIWRPAQISSPPKSRDVAEALRDTVGLAVEGLMGPHDLVLDEVSGGLDSAIVAASLVEQGLAPRVTTCLNYFGDRAESDERRYARAVAEHLGLPLTCVAKPLKALTAMDFEEVSRGLRPAFAATDPSRDRDTAARIDALGASALVTGHGGDLVFFQMPTSLIAADRLEAAGLRGLSAGYLGDVARFTRKPVWSILGDLVRPNATSRPFGRPDAHSVTGHAILDPWTADAGAWPPAKRFQLTSIFRSQLAHGWSRRVAVADVLNPLLAQPVVELCLGLSVGELVEGGRDRGLARRAFADRLPPQIVIRRSKGALDSHYGRMIALSLDYLRPLLLDGCLAEAGVVDRQALNQALTPEHLILNHAVGEIFLAVVIEHWVRWWQTRVPDSAQAPRPRP
jgi:asparagine synthase (glutamine-hydrolysing)